MYTIYNVLLAAITFILAPLAGIALLARKKYRAGFAEKCGRIQPWAGADRPIWVHAVSVGEVMAAVPLIREIKARYPALPLLVSTITETGHATALQHLKMADRIIYFPFDYPFIVGRVIRAIKPRIFLMLETEIWPNFLRELSRRRVPALMISGRISERSYKSYELFGFFFKRVLALIDCLCMQSTEDADRIVKIGAPAARVLVCGNIKFDLQVPPISAVEQESLQGEYGFATGQPVFIAGSTHRGEEEIAIDAFKKIRKHHADAVLVLAPRHPERFDEVEGLLRESGLAYARRTDLKASAKPVKSLSVILLDTIGELFKTYSMGTVVFIGGSLVPIGGHNVLEPAVFGKAVMFGRYMHNFREIARMLLQKKAGIQVDTPQQFAAEALRLLADPAVCREIGRNAFRVIEENSGAVKRSVDLLDPVLQKTI